MTHVTNACYLLGRTKHVIPEVDLSAHLADKTKSLKNQCLVRNSSISAFSSLKLKWLLMILEDNIVSYIVMNAEVSKMHPLCHNWEGVILNLEVISLPTVLVLIANTLHLLHAGYSIRCTIKWIPSKTKVRSIAFFPLVANRKVTQKVELAKFDLQT